MIVIKYWWNIEKLGIKWKILNVYILNRIIIGKCIFNLLYFIGIKFYFLYE